MSFLSQLFKTNSTEVTPLLGGPTKAAVPMVVKKPITEMVPLVEVETKHVLLPERLRRWKELKQEINELEALIETEVLELGKTLTVGDVRASYSKGRTTCDYEAIATEMAVPEAVLMRYTEPKVNYKKLVESNPPTKKLMEKHTKVSSPSVTVKLI